MSKVKIQTTGAPRAIGPYSQGVVQGGWLFISGQIPLDPATGEVAPGDIQAQAERALKNLGAVLAQAGMDYSHVLKTTVYMNNLTEFAGMNEVYARFFVEPFPARSTVEVSDLPKGVGLEVEAVAFKP